jgi:Bacterial regulatory protein, Fis family
MEPKQHHSASGLAVDPRYDSNLISRRARYLEDLLLNFLAEVGMVGSSQDLEIEHGLNLREEVRRFEIDLIKYALQRTYGHQGRAAALLGVKKTTLNAKIKLYQLQTKLFRRARHYESNALRTSSGSALVRASEASPTFKETLT